MKLISWNVNGIRAALKKGFMNFFDQIDADVFCIQETKARPEQVDIPLTDNYFKYWNSAEKKGYSGTAIFARIKPLNVTYGFGIDEHDNEGRVITLEFEQYYLVNVYTPNSKRGLERLDYRFSKWDFEFLKHCKTLELSKPVIFCGDLNVAHKEIDLKNPKTNHFNAGFTDEERAGFDNIIDAGFIDTFREFEKEGDHYTWWSYMRQARDRNIGWRIDYFCVSDSVKSKLISASIHPEIHGSDHCPISIEIDI
jgi:exodeoxyribonuclease III